jgi:hypothetical protein
MTLKLMTLLIEYFYAGCHLCSMSFMLIVTNDDCRNAERCSAECRLTVGRLQLYPQILDIPENGFGDKAL